MSTEWMSVETGRVVGVVSARAAGQGRRWTWVEMVSGRTRVVSERGERSVVAWVVGQMQEVVDDSQREQPTVEEYCASRWPEAEQ